MDVIAQPKASSHFSWVLLLLLELTSQAEQSYNALGVISVTQVHPETGGSEQLAGTSPIPGEEDISAGDLAEPLPPLQGRTAPYLCDRAQEHNGVTKA